MSEYVFLYESGKGDPIAYRSWDQAVEAMCYNFDSLEEFMQDLERWDVWYEYEPESYYFSADDGPRISRLRVI